MRGKGRKLGRQPCVRVLVLGKGGACGCHHWRVMCEWEATQTCFLLCVGSSRGRTGKGEGGEGTGESWARDYVRGSLARVEIMDASIWKSCLFVAGHSGKYILVARNVGQC